MRSILILGVVVGFLGAQVATASSAKVAGREPSWLKSIPGYKVPDGFKFSDGYVFLTKDQKKELLTAAKKEASRTVAEVKAEDNAGEKISESEESSQLQTFITNLNAARTAKDLDKLIDQADKDAANADSPDDLKLYSAQLAVMKASRGWLYKVRPFVNGKLRIEHSARNAVVTAGKALAVFQNVIFPDTQWDAGYEYVNSPDEADLSVLRTSLEIQNYAMTTVLPRLVTAAGRLQELALKKTFNTPHGEIVWDQMAVFGKFRGDQIGRFRIVKPANIHALVSAYNLAISSLEYSYCYNVDGIIEVLDEFNDKFLKGSILPDASGVTARDRAEILNKPGNRAFLTRKSDDEIQRNIKRSTADLMEKSQGHLLEAITEAQLSYEGLLKSAEKGFDFITPGAIRPFQGILNKSFDNALAMWSQDGFEATSDVTGERLKTNLPQFFKHPPEDLKGFAPVFTGSDGKELPKDDEFETKKYKVKLIGNLQRTASYEVRNWRAGSASNWNYGNFQTYFPQVTDKKTVSLATQILSQTWGAANLFVFVQ